MKTSFTAPLHTHILLWKLIFDFWVMHQCQLVHSIWLLRTTTVIQLDFPHSFQRFNETLGLTTDHLFSMLPMPLIMTINVYLALCLLKTFSRPKRFSEYYFFQLAKNELIMFRYYPKYYLEFAAFQIWLVCSIRKYMS